MEFIKQLFDFFEPGSGFAAYLGLVLSLLAIAISVHVEHKNRFNIKVECHDIHLFRSPDTSLGNVYAVTFKIRIINRSSAPVQISDICLNLKTGYIESCLKQKTDFTVERYNGDSSETIDFKQSLLILPEYLQPYGEVSGRVLFVKSGNEYPNKLNKSSITVVTSRGNKNINILVPSEEYLNLMFK